MLDGLGHLLRSLGLDGSAVPADVEGGGRPLRYRSLTAASELLVILDNAPDAHQIRPLVRAGARCRAVITSRAALTTLGGVHHLHLTGLGDVRHLHLAGLVDRDAVTLLSRIAGPDRVQREPEAAAEIAGLCGGFPWPSGVAGARLAARPDWRLADLADRLADATRRLDALQYDDLAVRASIAVSHRHLREEPSGHDAAYVLPLLGLLDTPTHTLAAPAGWPGSRAEAALELLRDARLLEAVGRDRYRFHDLIRLYAREQAAGELSEVERAAALRRGFRGSTTTWPRSTPPHSTCTPRFRSPITGRSSPASRSPTHGRPVSGPRRSGTTSLP
ncbi:hypothetical protein ACIHFD_35845 [Nonomuraea sp. NPDC051941]|uniref:hypothetical protein n=1 Tax=Nonomuraea sp. NPDC051941 TaxID=3364373 RepID=UPI0037CAF26F